MGNEANKPTVFWRKNRKPTIDYMHDSIFASDRQLEDQRRLMELNRNPKAYEATKVDKVRSQLLAAPVGQTRAVAMKANVLNKIVREASGVHNYTIIAPPRMAGDKMKKETLDPETNPFVKPYAKESKQKPVLVSYGHRPRSASRTFHPATMRMRLRHGEILPTKTDGTTTVGLSVAVLTKVLRAPKIVNALEAKLLADQDVAKNSLPFEQQYGNDHHPLNDLFFTKEQQQEMFLDFHGPSRKSKSEGGLNDMFSATDSTSWISSKPKKQAELEPVRIYFRQHPLLLLLLLLLLLCLKLWAVG
jgi:hypothetical protein